MSTSAFFSSFVTKFIYLKRAFGSAPFRLLDVGAGNHSASKALNVFPKCAYYGLDLNKAYNNDEADFKLMQGFYELDLTMLQYDAIPDDFFDGIWMVHVIEHLYNGDEVLLHLLPKLKRGGYMYIEYPGKKSTTLPSMYGTLNFSDDATHVRLYSVAEISAIMQRNDCKIIDSGTRRNFWFIAAMPFRIVKSLLTGKKIQGNIFWDITGFAEYVFLKKN